MNLEDAMLSQKVSVYDFIVKKYPEWESPKRLKGLSSLTKKERKGQGQPVDTIFVKGVTEMF